MNKQRDNIRAAHLQLTADLAAGDPKAKAFASMLGGELNTTRKSLNMPPLSPASDIWFGSAIRGVLILGESTYGSDPRLVDYIPLWTRRGVRDTTFARIFNAFSGTHTSRATDTEREAFWASVAFYNFVTRSVGPSRDHRPTVADYKNAAAALPAILRLLKPRGILVLGREQSEFSAIVIRDLGIPFVVTRHPTARGVPTSELQAAWNELQSKTRNA